MFPNVFSAELTSVIRLSSFSMMVPSKELTSKGWTKRMIALLGPHHRKNHEGLLMWRREHVEALINTPEFITELVMLLKINQSQSREVTEDLLLLTCRAIYDINKIIKTKVHGSAYANRCYKLKFFMMQYLYDNGFIKAEHEIDTNLFRLTVTIKGQTFIWHQPVNQGSQFITSYTSVVSCHDEPDAPIHNHDAFGLEGFVSDVVIAILLAKFDTSVIA